MKESTIDDKKLEINNILEKTMITNILKDDTNSNKKYLMTSLKDSKMINTFNEKLINKKLKHKSTSNELADKKIDEQKIIKKELEDNIDKQVNEKI